MKSLTNSMDNTDMHPPKTLDDMIFEHRNKAYGAYELRKHYTTNINQALFIGVACFLLMLLTNLIFAKEKNENLNNKVVVINVKRLSNEEQPIIKKQKEPKPPKEIEQKKEVQYTDIQIVEYTEHENPPPPQSEIEISVISTVDKTGSISNEIAETPLSDVKTTENALIELPEEDNIAFMISIMITWNSSFQCPRCRLRFPDVQNI